MEIIHTPVLLQECLKWLSPAGEPFEQHALMVDSTLGEGGHTEAFLAAFPALRVIGVDADGTIQSRARERLAPFGERAHFYHGWFNDFYHDFPAGADRPHLLLFDLGISVYHYEKSGRGFSFRHDEPLDMRLDTDVGMSAADIVNGAREDALADMLYAYSDEKYSRRIAWAIVEARKGGNIVSAKALADIVWHAVPSSYRYGAIHPATRTFQALRIAVNGELKRLPDALADAFAVLQTGGKMGVITFHSLEDRIVKQYFRNLGRRCVCPPEQAVCSCGGTPCADVLTRKPVEPSAGEIRENSPSRSAKLRVIRKLRDASEKHRADYIGSVVGSAARM